MSMSHEYPEILKDLRLIIFRSLTKAGEDPVKSKSLAEKSVSGIHKHFAGQQIYIPRAAMIRDYEMISRFDGSNRSQLCREYGLSEQRFYQILKRIRREQRTRNSLLNFAGKD